MNCLYCQEPLTKQIINWKCTNCHICVKFKNKLPYTIYHHGVCEGQKYWSYYNLSNQMLTILQYKKESAKRYKIIYKAKYDDYHPSVVSKIIKFKIFT